jgi:transcriptional regulator with XRE-family HTH domain
MSTNSENKSYLAYDDTMTDFINYLDGLLKDVSEQELSLSTNIYYVGAKSIIKHERIPSEEQLRLIIDRYADGSVAGLAKVCENNPRLTYIYWGLLHPESSPTSAIAMALKTYADLKGISRNEILEKSGLSSPAYSSYIYGRRKLTYNTFLRLASAVGLEPFEALDKLNMSEGDQDKKIFLEKLRNARINKQISIENAAKLCGIKIDNYINLENGRIPLTKKVLKRISIVFKLDYYEMAKLAIAGGLISESAFKYNKVALEKPFPKSLVINEGTLTKFFKNTIMEYKYVADDTQYVSTFSLTVLSLLILLDAGTWQDLSEELYIMKKITSDMTYQPSEIWMQNKNISYPLLDSSILDVSDATKTLNEYRIKYDLNQMDIRSITLFTGRLTDGASCTTNISYIYSLLNALKCPVSYGLEKYLEHIEPSKDVITLDEVFSELDTELSWSFFGNNIESDDIKFLIKAFFGHGKAIEKLRNIVNIGFPQPLNLAQFFPLSL